MAEEMVTMKWATEYADQNYKEGLAKGRKDGYAEASKRAIEMAVFNIPYICKFENTPARLVGIVIPDDTQK